MNSKLILIALGVLFSVQDQELKMNSNSTEQGSNTDILQEELYQYLLEGIEQKQSNTIRSVISNRPQLLDTAKQYYPLAELEGDELIIPYLHQKVKELKEIRYRISDNSFGPGKKEFVLNPQLIISHNASGSTLLFNNAFPVSFYRSPRVARTSLEQITVVLQRIYKMFFPLTRDLIETNPMHITGYIHYRGYQVHENVFDSIEELSSLCWMLTKEGSVYFYPSKIDELEDTIMIYGLLYIMRDKKDMYYHFGEVSAIYGKANKPVLREFKLIFYPYIKNISGSDIGN